MSESWAPDYSYTTNNVFSQPVDRDSFSYSSLISGKNFYGLGVDPVNDNIYLSDARNFQTQGIIYAYSSTGTILDSASVDRGPRDFIFVEGQ
jgi:DNA-binding beta-propeller fold protein YncE